MSDYRKSSFCNCADCVEVSIGKFGVTVRDSKDPDHPKQVPLWFSHGEWAAFTAGVRAGEFDSPEASS